MPKGEITMDKDQYLQIINDQLKEAEANMNDAHKKFPGGKKLNTMPL
jgi:hypothetical protein